MKKSPAAHKGPPASVGGGGLTTIGNQVASTLTTFKKLTSVASSTAAVDVSFEHDDKLRSEAKALQSSSPSLLSTPPKLIQRMPQLTPFVEKALLYSFTDSSPPLSATTAAGASGANTKKRKAHPTHDDHHKDTCEDKDRGDALDMPMPMGSSKCDVMVMRERRPEREGAKVRFDITKRDADKDGNVRENGGVAAALGSSSSSRTFSQNPSLILPPIAVGPARSNANNHNNSFAGRFRFLSLHGEEGPSEGIVNLFGGIGINGGSSGTTSTHPTIHAYSSREGGRLNPDLLAICKALDEASREIERILTLNSDTDGGAGRGDVGMGGGRGRGASQDNQYKREGGNVNEKTDGGMAQHTKLGGAEELVERARAPSQVSVNSTSGTESTCSASTGTEKTTSLAAKKKDTAALGVVRNSYGFTPAEEKFDNSPSTRLNPHSRSQEVIASGRSVAAPSSSSPTSVSPPLDALKRLYALHRDACREASRLVLREHTRDYEEARSGRTSPRSHQREAPWRSPSPPSPRGPSISSFSFLFDVIQATLRTSDAYIAALTNRVQERDAEGREAVAERSASDALIAALKQKVTALEMVLEGVDSASQLKDELVRAKREITVLKRQIYAFEETKKEVALVVNELGNQLFAAKASTALTEQALRAEIAALNNQLSLYQRGARGGRRSTTSVEEMMTAAVLPNAHTQNNGAFAPDAGSANKDASSTLLSRFSSDNLHTSVMRDSADAAGIEESTRGLGLGPRRRVDTGDGAVGVSAALATLRGLPLSVK